MNFFKRSRRQRDFAADAAAHLEQETADNIARGMAPEEARLAALRKFGNRTLTKEQVYDMNTITWLEALGQDLRFGLRMLRRNPGFTLVAVLSLALGIGANTAIFTLVDQILLRLLPVERPEELVRLRVDGGRVGSQSGDGLHTFSYPMYTAFRDQQTVFTGLAGSVPSEANMTVGERSERVTLSFVSGNYFQVMGVRAHVGRLLTAADDEKKGAHPVAVLQHDFWQVRFQGNANVVGQTIALNGVTLTVIGVAAPGYEGTNTGFPNQVWMPVTMMSTLNPARDDLADERFSWFYLYGRLKPGVSLTQAQAAMRVLFRQRQEEELKAPFFSRLPQAKEPFLKQSFALSPAAQGDGSLRERLEGALKILQGLVAAVLLIACANVAGLLLARGAARHRELAIRGSIGAGQTRLMRQLFTESLMLALAGGAGGLLIGSWLTKALIAALPFDQNAFSISATPDMRILAFTLVLTTATALVFGLLPAWQNSRVNAASALREEAGAIAGGHRQVRLRKFFVGLQVALCALLLLPAGLFVQTLRNLRQVDLGLKTENVLVFRMGPAINYDDARKLQVYRAVLEELAAVPGVSAVGANRQMLFTGGRSDGGLTVPGVDEKDQPQSFFNWVTPGYFAALGVPVKAGRDFTWNDWGTSRKLAIVNETVTGLYFKGPTPLGRMFGRGTRVAADHEVIGQTADSRYHRVRGEIPPQIFMSLDSNIRFINSVNVFARVTAPPSEVMPALRAAVARVDRNFVLWQVRTLEEQIGLNLSPERLVSFLSAGFALLATVLAVIGLNGVLAFVVARRTKEIGIRVALGAPRRAVIGLVASEMTLVVVAGLVLGVAGGYALSRYLESQLYGVKVHDPLVFAAVLGILLSAAAAAIVLPCWRASRIDPLRALRWE